MITAEDLLARPFGTIDAMVAHHAAASPDRPALIVDQGSGPAEYVDYETLDRLAGRVAAGLQRDGMRPGDTAAVCADLSLAFAALVVGCFRAGVVVAPLATWLDQPAFDAVLADSAARRLFLGPGLYPALDRTAAPPIVQTDALDAWLPGEGAVPAPVEVEPATVDIILYSSGTTGTPKGVAQRRATHWALKGLFGVARGVMMVTTPAYAAATLGALIPTLATGGAAVLMPRFDARRFLELAERHRATHAMLVPSQYRRILAEPGFDDFDLSSFVLKISTSAPLGEEMKREIVRRWPGGFRELYGMSEGTCFFRLDAHLHPDRLHTVGLPAPGCEVRVVDDQGRELPQGHIGEIVGRSGAMMAGYHRRPEATAAVEWFDAEGVRFVRTGDLGYLEPDGFLVLAGRSRDMIISGGLNIYAADIERVLEQHPDVEEAAVVGAPSERWGETPVAFVVAGAGLDAAALQAWANARIGKMQRVSAIEMVEALPRSPVGKVLKRELRSRLAAVS